MRRYCCITGVWLFVWSFNARFRAVASSCRPDTRPEGRALSNKAREVRGLRMPLAAGAASGLQANPAEALGEAGTLGLRSGEIGSSLGRETSLQLHEAALVSRHGKSGPQLQGGVEVRESAVQSPLPQVREAAVAQGGRRAAGDGGFP